MLLVSWCCGDMVLRGFLDFVCWVFLCQTSLLHTSRGSLGFLLRASCFQFYLFPFDRGFRGKGGLGRVRYTRLQWTVSLFRIEI